MVCLFVNMWLLVSFGCEVVQHCLLQLFENWVDNKVVCLDSNKVVKWL